jgi:hypothetical protein
MTPSTTVAMSSMRGERGKENVAVLSTPFRDPEHQPSRPHDEQLRFSAFDLTNSFEPHTHVRHLRLHLALHIDAFEASASSHASVPAFASSPNFNDMAIVSIASRFRASNSGPSSIAPLITTDIPRSTLLAQHFLNFEPLPHGHGSFRAGAIASRNVWTSACTCDRVKKRTCSVDKRVRV